MGRRGRGAKGSERWRSLDGKGLGSPEEPRALERVALLAGNKETKTLGKCDVVAPRGGWLYGAGDLRVALSHEQGARDGSGPITPAMGGSTASIQGDLATLKDVADICVREREFLDISAAPAAYVVPARNIERTLGVDDAADDV